MDSKMVVQTAPLVPRGVLEGQRRGSDHAWSGYPWHSDSKGIFRARALAKDAQARTRRLRLCLSWSRFSSCGFEMRIQCLNPRRMIDLPLFLKKFTTSSSSRLFLPSEYGARFSATSLIRLSWAIDVFGVGHSYLE